MNTASTYDVIIIGGGLAGLSLAIQLADAGRSVVLFEKNSYPFHRVCGEYISMESWSFLERIGMPLEDLCLPKINTLRVSSVSGKVLTHPLDTGGFGISRYLLDSTLANIAKEKGAGVMEGCRVDGVENEGDFFLVSAQQKTVRGKVVAGAFGKRSVMDKKLARPFAMKPQPPAKNWVGVKYHVKATLPDHIIELHNFDGGYCGISKVEGDRYCLCYLTKAENLREFNGNIRQMEESLLSQNPFLKNYFSERKNFLLESPETISQIYFEDKEPVAKNILMMGDAAGLIAPLCGNGMSMAFHASTIGFAWIEKFLSGKISREKMEMEYAERWKKTFSVRLKIGRALQPLLVKSYLSKPSIATLKYFPFLTKQIIKATHGKPF